MIAVSERRRKDQGGFALLLVFALSAAIAISLYLELPRAAFEAQRGKEQLTMERGKEYMRGIKLFVRKNRRFPATMDELEKFQDKRFLRRRYKDPLTGKDEWREIHVNNMGILTDSKVKKPQQQQGSQYNNTFITEGPGLGQANAPGAGGQAVNLATRRRASDGQMVGPNDQQGPVDPNTLAMGGGAPPPPTDGANAQLPPGQQNAVQGQPPQQFPGQPMPGQQQQPGQPSTGPQTIGQLPFGQAPSGQQPGQQPQPGQASPAPPPPQRYDLLGNALPNPQQQNQPQQTYPTNAAVQQGRPGGAISGQPGTAPGQNEATRLIQNMLTTPRPMPGTGIQTAGQIAGGIAGVASKFEGDSIMVYEERQRYEEWEFIYDMKKDAANNPVDRALQNSAQSGQQIDPQTGKVINQQGQGGLGGPGGSRGNTGFGSGTGFGNSGFGNSGFGNSGGFGNQNGGQRPTNPRR